MTVIEAQQQRTNVQVRVDLDGRHTSAVLFHDGAQRAGNNALANAADDTTGDEDVLHGSSQHTQSAQPVQRSVQRSHVLVLEIEPLQANPSAVHFCMKRNQPLPQKFIVQINFAR